MTATTFDDVDPRGAIEANRSSDRWLLLDATAQWCQPCKMMERTTWCDARVVAWVQAHGLAARLDIDKHAELAQTLGIKAVPTIIAYRRGAEFDRIRGRRSADELLGWLRGIEAGRTELDAARAAVGDGTDIGARLALATLLARMDRAAEATEEYAWLWEHMLEHDPSFAEVRLNTMAWDIGSLAKHHEPAGARFAAFRPPLEAAAHDPQADPALLREWWTINQIIGDTDSTLTFFDRVRDDPGWCERLVDQLPLFATLLMDRGRWSDFGRFIRGPVAILRAQWELAEQARELLPIKHPELFGPGHEQRLARLTSRSVRGTAAQTRAGLMAAGRVQEADGLLAEALRLDDSTEMREALREADETACAGLPLKADACSARG